MPNRAGIEQEWAARGFSCDLWADPPGRCWEDFTHGVDELVMVLEGRVELEIETEGIDSMRVIRCLHPGPLG